MNARPASRPLVLVIEDDPTLGPALLQRLRLEGFEPRLVADGAQALSFVAARRPDIVLSDIRLPDMDGERIWTKLVAVHGPVPTWFMTAFGDIGQAVRLVKAGARDYLTKPVDMDALVRTIDALRQPGAAPGPVSDGAGLGASPAMAALSLQLARAARSDLPVLLTGETGSGKEVAARFLHARSPRAARPFVALNCAAIPRELAESLLFGHEKGAFTGASARRIGAAEEAADGALFLDEVAELPLEVQAKLLRLIEAKAFRPLGGEADRPFRARIVSATHADLEARVRAREFREDLYYRLNVVGLVVPPLRERREDILPLAHHFLKEAAARLDGSQLAARAFAADAGDALLAHAWPGNVREMRNRIERAVALSELPEIGVLDLFSERGLAAPPAGNVEDGLDAAAREAIRRKVREALDKAGGNRAAAARALGVSRTTIWKYGRK